MKETKSIKLVKFNKKFISKKYISWLNDKNLMKYSENRYKKHTKLSCKKYLNNFNKTHNKFFAIIDTDNSDHIGNITAIIDKKNNTADIGILIGKKNRGYGQIAWKTMMNYLFKINIRKITGGCMRNNKAMIKIFIKSKMNFEYIKKKHFLYDKKKLIDFIGYYKFKK
mgnify:CR=1 FL=1